MTAFAVAESATLLILAIRHCRDISPQAPVHFLVIPKHRDGLTQLSNSTEKNEPVLGHILHIASKVAKQGGDAAQLERSRLPLTGILKPSSSLQRQRSWASACRGL